MRVPYRGNAGGAHGEGAIAIEIESIKEKMRGGSSPFISDSFKPILAREGPASQLFGL